MITCFRLFGPIQVSSVRTQILAVLIVYFTAGTSHADGEKHALLIGNSSYEVGALNNPGNDARLMQRVLGDLGFKVTLKLDLNHQAMDAAIADFSRSLPRGSLALFFFAGHGISVDDKNYLIPVDARIDDPTAVKYKTVAEAFVKDHLEGAASNLNVLVLDCCRDNPFRSWARNIGPTHLSTSGAGEIPEGWIVAYAVAGGKAALDGTGNNSPFTEALAQVLSEQRPEGLLLRDVFFDASHAVKRNSGQRPFLYMDASIDRFFLRDPTARDVIADAAKDSSPLTPKTESMVGPQVSPSIDETVSPAPESTGGESIRRHPLLEQANNFASSGQLDLAIDAYSAVINNDNLPPDLRENARKGRGASYVERGEISDLRRALIDYQAVGTPGFMYVIQRNEAPLKVGSDTNGLVRKGQIVLVTKSHGDWFWVSSVQGDTEKSGWLSQDAFGSAVPTAAPAATNSAGIPNSSSVGIRPSSEPLSFQQQPAASQQQVVAQPQPFPQQQLSQPQFQPQQQNFNGFQNQGQSGVGNSQFRDQRSMGAGNQGTRIPAGADAWTRDYMQRHGRPPSIWETPKWESPAEIQQKRAQGLLR